MFKIEQKGDFNNTESFLKKMSKFDMKDVLDKAGRLGVEALSRATPIDSGLAAQSWDYFIESDAGTIRLVWTNHDIENGFPVILMLQYGHGTGTGGYVQGIDFINPAMEPVFDQIAEEVWKAVSSA